MFKAKVHKYQKVVKSLLLQFLLMEQKGKVYYETVK